MRASGLLSGLVVGSVLAGGTLVSADVYTRTINGETYDFLDYTYHSVDSSASSYRHVNGRLYVPPSYDPDTPQKLVVFLHGYGERGENSSYNNRLHVSRNIDNLLINARSQGFLIFAPQSNAGWWAELDKALNMIGRVMEDYNIDPTRVYVTGISAGGQGTQMTLRAKTNAFAAYSPLSMAGSQFTSPQDAQVAVNLPIWYTMARNDSLLSQARNSVTNLTLAMGGTAPTYPSSGTFEYQYKTVRYTEYGSGGHSNAVWSNGPYNNPEWYNWMFSHTSAVTEPVQNVPIHIKFSSTSMPGGFSDSAGNRWNMSGGYRISENLEYSVVFARDAQNNPTTVRLEVTQILGGMGTEVPSITAFDDASVAGSYWRTQYNLTGQLMLHGLTPGGLYDLDVFASINNNDGNRWYRGIYQVNDQSIEFDAAFNTSDFISFDNLIADDKGTLTLSITPTGGSRMAVINTLTLTAVPEPAALGLCVLSGVLLLRRRR